MYIFSSVTLQKIDLHKLEWTKKWIIPNFVRKSKSLQMSYGDQSRQTSTIGWYWRKRTWSMDFITKTTWSVIIWSRTFVIFTILSLCYSLIRYFYQKSNITAMIIKSLHFCINWALLLLLHEIRKLYYYLHPRILKSIRQRRVQENLLTSWSSSTWSYHGIGSYQNLKLYTLHQYERKRTCSLPNIFFLIINLVAHCMN